MILLLFGEVVFLGLGWLLLISVAVRERHTPPGPSQEGRFGCGVLVGNERFVAWGIPLLRGD